jgi:predicted transcriptional regulator of viral defense system
MDRNLEIPPRVGTELVRRLAQEGRRIFTFEEAEEFAAPIGISPDYLRHVFHHLARTGWVVRLRKGLYALSSPVSGAAPVHEFEIAMALVDPAAISHWSALHYHGLTEQAPLRVFVTTTTETSVPRARGRGKGRSTRGYLVGETAFQFIQVKPKRYFGVEKVWIGEARVTVTDAEKTLLDGLSMPKYCGDFAEVLHAFEVRGSNLVLDKIITYALRLDAVTAKRLGWVLDRRGVAPHLLTHLVEVPLSSYAKLDPTGPAKGPCSKRWMIRENLPGRVSS